MEDNDLGRSVPDGLSSLRDEAGKPSSPKASIPSAVRKVVTNRCHGGFGLSHAAVLAYAMHKGLTLYPEHDGREFGFWTYWLLPPDKRPAPQDDWHLWDQERRIQSNREHAEAELTPRDIARDDPSLVAVVEALGAEANGHFAKLQVTEIPADVDWTIEEYDGLEWVAERHRIW